LRPILERWRGDLVGITADEVTALLGGLVSDVDKAALTGEFAEVCAESFRSSVATGIEGWLEDDFAFMQDWGFDLGSIRTPVAVWQGGQDRMVPYTHGRWLAAHIAGAHSRLLDDEGHLALLNQMDRVLDDLLDLAGLRQPARS
jgi:pimeloyl-ACP methyl ester carboxylesterase